MTDDEKYLWTIGYFLFHFIIDESEGDAVSIIASGVDDFSGLHQILDPQERWEIAAEFINEMTDGDYDDDEIKEHVIH